MLAGRAVDGHSHTLAQAGLHSSTPYGFAQLA